MVLASHMTIVRSLTMLCTITHPSMQHYEAMISENLPSSDIYSPFIWRGDLKLFLKSVTDSTTAGQAPGRRDSRSTVLQMFSKMLSEERAPLG